MSDIDQQFTSLQTKLLIDIKELLIRIKEILETNKNNKE